MASSTSSAADRFGNALMDVAPRELLKAMTTSSAPSSRLNSLLVLVSQSVPIVLSVSSISFVRQVLHFVEHRLDVFTASIGPIDDS